MEEDPGLIHARGLREPPDGPPPLRVEDIRLVHRVVGTNHVFTSPDVPELHVAHRDYETARADVEPALVALHEVKNRIRARQEFRDERIKMGTAVLLGTEPGTDKKTA